MEEQETALWSRISGGTAADRGPIGPELLAISGELWAIQGQYRALSGQIRGNATLRAQQAKVQQVQTALGGLYNYLTEGKFQASPPEVPRQSAAQRLREIIRQTELECGRLEALSRRATGISAEILQQSSIKLQETLPALVTILGGLA